MKGETNLVLLEAALAEEIEMVDTYSQVITLSGNTEVARALEVLVRESRGHAAKVSSIIVGYPRDENSGLSETDWRVAERMAKNPEFALTKEALSWYKDKAGGVQELNAEGNKDITRTLEAFLKLERRAFAIYHVLSTRVLPNAAKNDMARISKDESRHYDMLEELIISLSVGKHRGKKGGKPLGKKDMFFCSDCRRMYFNNPGKCGVCGADEIVPVE